jgi:hypothetical protein
MTCIQCQQLPRHFDIRTPDDLRKVISIAQQAVGDGIIEEIDFKDWNEPFSNVNPSGPWDDIVGHRFRCRHCSRNFELTAETYHGSGGAWTSS